MRIYLIRHGQSTNNALQDQTNRTHDPDLTDIGQIQAERLAEHFTSSGDINGDQYRLTHIYCSPMKRSLDTARPLADATGLDPEVWVDIHETGGVFMFNDDGSTTGYPGLTRSQITDLHPSYALPDNITDDGWWNVDKGREVPADWIARAVRVALELNRRQHEEDACIALVSHAAFLDALMKAFLNQVPLHPQQLFYAHYNTGVTRLDFNEHDGYYRDNMRLHYLNRVDHLTVEQRTW